MNRSISKQIAQLLKRSHEPYVSVKPSTIAGSGVFTCRTITSNQLPLVVGLYPGIFTPPLPLHAMRSSAEYLANKIPPSYFFNGVDMDSNAYIINLQRSGGYIDGCALQSQYCKTSKLDSNPSACGHLVNHGGYHYNTEVIDFCWDEISLDQGEGSEPWYQIPNELRADGSPWYYDRMHEELVSFASEMQFDCTIMARTYGAALVLTHPLDEGEELLLDYKLTKPFPKWAEEWYEQNVDLIANHSMQ